MTATRPHRPFRFATRAIHHAYDATEHQGAEAGVVVATGMAAVGTLLLSLLSQGDEATLAPGAAEDLIRLSIGLEDVDDLVDDLRGALSSL